MGSPLGPIFADIFMGFCEQKLLKQSIEVHTDWYVRYVDDSFILLKSNSYASDLLKIFNSIHPSLHFTCESEANNSISFLDVNCTRRPDGSVQTSVFRKSTWTGLYTSFYSFVPKSYKIGLIKNLVHRSVRICSFDTIQDELQLLRRVFIDNGYPLFFIDKYIVPPQPKPPPVFGPEKKIVYAFLPFVGDKAAEFVKRALSSTLKCAQAVKARVVFDTTRIPLASPKDSLPVSAQSNVIYRFVCSCSSMYIGRTSRSLKERAKEHVPKWVLDGKQHPPRSTSLPESAVTRHLLNNGCSLLNVRDRFQVIMRCKSKYLLKINEALLIKTIGPDLCVQKQHLFTLSLPW